MTIHPHGVGRSLVDAAVRRARAWGLDEMQWQTPEWNTDGIGFCDRLGAMRSPKFRYRLSTVEG
ncbi:GNAT family N-acetyltransferase [Micromonospora sp. NPDC050187]|uniref:GNAT family N-acetyltransferase n=1 Tax=Micromonospora sp. NPDC050187 TaxID=3364277 RepID=UPI0037A3AF36